jgi:hypothetical protein
LLFDILFDRKMICIFLKIAPRIKERMMTNGTMMVGYQRLDEHPNFFRAIISNIATTKEDIISMIDEIHELGHDL